MLGFRASGTTMENQMENEIENNMETGFTEGLQRNLGYHNSRNMDPTTLMGLSYRTFINSVQLTKSPDYSPIP